MCSSLAGTYLGSILWRVEEGQPRFDRAGESRGRGLWLVGLCRQRAGQLVCRCWRDSGSGGHVYVGRSISRCSEVIRPGSICFLSSCGDRYSEGYKCRPDSDLYALGRQRKEEAVYNPHNQALLRFIFYILGIVHTSTVLEIHLMDGHQPPPISGLDLPEEVQSENDGGSQVLLKEILRIRSTVGRWL